MRFLAYFKSSLASTHMIPAVFTVPRWMPFRAWAARREARRFARRHRITFVSIRPSA